MKYKIVLLLIFAFIICENVFSQTIKIDYDSIEQKPYEFTVNKNKVRLKVLDTVEDNVVFQKFSSKWEDIDTFDYHRSFYFRDMNNDGFLDIVLPDKWESEVWFYNPLKNTYIESCCYYIYTVRDDTIKLINKEKNIYYDYLLYKDGVWYSNLYQIKNYKRFDLGLITNETKISKNDEDYETTWIMISKIINNDNENKQLFQKIKWNSHKDFDYETYWKNNWQKFLPQKN